MRFDKLSAPADGLSFPLTITRREPVMKPYSQPIPCCVQRRSNCQRALPCQKSSDSQRKIKRCAFVRFGFGPDAPAMPGDDTLHQRQSHSCSLELTLRVQTLKYTK